MIHEPSFSDILDGTADPYPEVTRATRLVSQLREIASWNDFAASLVDQHVRKGSLSDRQMDAADRMLAKIAANCAEREANEARATSIDLTPVHQMFARAMESGYKRPTYRAAGLVLSLAPLHGRNAGSIYVKDDETGDYLGKVTEDLVFKPVRTAPQSASEALSCIARDPAHAAVQYGRQTGRCACCGRELTNADSIALGIGPICKDRWGF